LSLPCDTIAAVLKCPPANVLKHWPLVESALQASTDAYSDNVAVAALATIRVECPLFAPQKEKGGNSYYVSHYWENIAVRQGLGNLSDVDAIRYPGRGFIQLTGRWNYKHFGEKLGLDLVNFPEQAMEPEPAARIFALFFKERGCIDSANNRKWETLRKQVNGGQNGLEQFLYYITALEREMAPVP